jgi:hypothetical protein
MCQEYELLPTLGSLAHQNALAIAVFGAPAVGFSLLVDQPTHCGNYRSISLIHAFAKLISKIVASRLQPRLDELVSPCQSAFIAKRNI